MSAPLAGRPSDGADDRPRTSCYAAAPAACRDLIVVIVYDEYYDSREISERGRKFLQWWHGRLLDTIMAWTGKPASLLEVGAGWGFIGRAASERGVRYQGIELSARQAQSLREVHLDVVQARVPPYPEGVRVDMIYAAHLIEHFPTWQDAHAFTEASRDRLDKGGRLVIVAPDILSWRQHFWDVDWSHGYPTTLRRLEQLIEESGMELEKATYTAGGTFGLIAPSTFAFFASLVPISVGDWVTEKLLGRRFWYSLMGTLGWRQAIVVGRKTE